MREWLCIGSRLQGSPVTVRRGFTTRRYLEFSVLVEADDARAAAREFRHQTGVRAERIDGREVLGECEACTGLMFAGDRYVADSDGVRLCEGCGPKPEDLAALGIGTPAGQGVALG